MKKKELAAGLALLSISSALCLKIMKKVGEKLKKRRDRNNAEKSGPPGSSGRAFCYVEVKR